MQLAVLIILLHSVVPHHHHSEALKTADCSIESADINGSLLDLLGDIFHTDLGDDHLENWVKSNTGSWPQLDLENNQNWIPAAVLALNLHKNQSAQPLYTGPSRAYNFYASLYPHRGPPPYILA